MRSPIMKSLKCPIIGNVGTFKKLQKLYINKRLFEKQQSLQNMCFKKKASKSIRSVYVTLAFTIRRSCSMLVSVKMELGLIRNRFMFRTIVLHDCKQILYMFVICKKKLARKKVCENVSTYIKCCHRQQQTLLCGFMKFTREIFTIFVKFQQNSTTFPKKFFLLDEFCR